VQALARAPNGLLTNPRLGEQLFQFQSREVRRILVAQYEMRYEIVEETIYVLRLSGITLALGQRHEHAALVRVRLFSGPLCQLDISGLGHGQQGFGIQAGQSFEDGGIDSAAAQGMIYSYFCFPGLINHEHAPQNHHFD
jgi:hypothetical protein